MTNKPLLIKTVVRWLPLAIAVTGVIGFAHVALQQEYRLSFNDPQIQMAEDAARTLSAGAPIEQAVSSSTIDIAASLSPWVAVYDSSYAPVKSSGELNGAAPAIPAGVFKALKGEGGIVDSSGASTIERMHENRLTWQPQGGVRQAIVVVPIHGKIEGYVVAGRNMREVEARETALAELTIAAWIATMLATLAAIYIQYNAG